MSLILEALRKSEAERRLGSAPELLTAMPVMRVSAPRRRWPMPLAFGVAALVFIAVIYGWSRRETTTQATAPVTASAPTTTVAPASQSLPATPMASSPQRALPRPAPIQTQHPSSVPPTAIATPTPPAVVPTPVAAPPAPAEQPAEVKTASAEPTLLTLADLSADERSGLPTLKVTMHVYAEDPAKRFMIVDGQRVSEGARLADGVVLVRIRRDGAEIDVRGRRLLLPKP